MKLVVRTVFALLTIATTAMAQVITPVWVEHMNGEEGVTPANRLPILRKNLNKSENNNGTSEQVSFGKLLPYDSTRLLLYIRENGINEPVATPADLALAALYPDASLIWIDAATGPPIIPAGHSNAVALTIGVTPIAITGQGSQLDFFHEFGFDTAGNVYTGHKNKILRYAKTGVDTWSSTPTCAWTEPTIGATDCNGVPLDDSTNGGDGPQSMRWREFRVTGSGTNTVPFCGGGTWRMGSHTTIFKTADGTNFYPVAKLNSRDNGVTRGEYALGGQASSVVKYGWDSSRPNLQTVYTGHYPGTGYGARPSRCQADPDAPTHVLTPWSYTPTDSIYVLDREEGATNSQPAFIWEAAGKDGLPEVPTVDGDQYYDGNWSQALDANASLDYIVNYSMPSWNNQYPVISGTNYHRPGWIGAHRLDGSIALNSAWKLPCTEDDIANSDNGGVGNDWGYCGDVTVFPDTNAPASLKKATIFWSGAAYGFGVFTVQNVAATISAPPPSSITLTEADPLTIDVGVAGSPNTYQWRKGNVPLDGTVTNLDGSFRWPATVVQGVKKPKLYNPSVKVSDSGLYRLTVQNPINGILNTFDVNVTVNPDTNKPTVLSVTGLATPNTAGTNPYLVKVIFSKRIDPTTGGDTAHYSIPGATVIGVTLQSTALAASLSGDWREAILTTTGLTPGTSYTLTVSGVKDQSTAGNVIVPTPVAFKTPVLQQGGLTWDYYYVGTSGNISALYNSPVYPNAPMTNRTVTSFDTTPITAGGDLNNVVGYGPLGDNYGDSLSGWIKPTVSGNYYFFLASDDQSELWLSADATPQNAGVIAVETGCCHGFQETNSAAPPETVSALQSLVAGTSYFIRATHIEGGGGDYVKVAWRLDTDTNSAATLQPISGAFLSAYAPVPLPQFNTPVVSGGQVTISWTGTGTLLESTDLVTWTPVPGNPPSPYAVSAGSASKKFYRIQQ